MGNDYYNEYQSEKWGNIASLQVIDQVAYQRDAWQSAHETLRQKYNQLVEEFNDLNRRFKNVCNGADKEFFKVQRLDLERILLGNAGAAAAGEMNDKDWNLINKVYGNARSGNSEEAVQKVVEDAKPFVYDIANDTHIRNFLENEFRILRCDDHIGEYLKERIKLWNDVENRLPVPDSDERRKFVRDVMREAFLRTNQLLQDRFAMTVMGKYLETQSAAFSAGFAQHGSTTWTQPTTSGGGFAGPSSNPPVFTPSLQDKDFFSFDQYIERELQLSPWNKVMQFRDMTNLADKARHMKALLENRLLKRMRELLLRDRQLTAKMQEVEARDRTLAAKMQEVEKSNEQLKARITEMEDRKWKEILEREHESKKRTRRHKNEIEAIRSLAGEQIEELQRENQELRKQLAEGFSAPSPATKENQVRQADDDLPFAGVARNLPTRQGLGLQDITQKPKDSNNGGWSGPN
ncbi:DUF4200 domain-containing protein [Acidithiobacillus sp. VAN18-1]|uniref:DUF4200 domain-containing protein n=1 Tax=Igneacidithiobacillus copahuensis TaxID=2724909 RepID=A0AAE3CK96_9PROT|nr:DUF4200 domain-containing protein [Igneacidithiobacillus copahuensis]MBU2788647.1 DUF4200 domain-containing protein [Igneacidithiobacillus copahuensis]MBU2796669.1 DUF4200 domain-containing protein [Acidithiobacillus sp. VAN18-2]